MAAEVRTFRAIDGTEYHFYFGIGGIMAAEQAAGPGSTFGALLEEGLDGRLGYLAALIYGGLRVHHPEITLDDAWAMINGPDGTQIGKTMRAALVAAMPQATGKNPPKARGGTGTRSSPRGSKKASATKTSKR